MQIITVKKNSIIKYIVFAAIIAIGVSAVAFSKGKSHPASEVELYFTDARMMRLIPLKASVPERGTERMAQSILDALIEGHDDNPKIRRLIPKSKRCMTVKVKDMTAYVDIKKEMVENHPDGRDLEMLTVYSVVNSLTGLEGISRVRFTIEGKVRKDFKGYLDMRETFVPDYMV